MSIHFGLMIIFQSNFSLNEEFEFLVCMEQNLRGACPYYEEFSVYIKKILQHFRLNLACGENHIINSKWAITEEQKNFLLSRPINNLRTYFKFSNESNRKKLKNLLSNKLPSKKINKTIFFNISKRTENKNFPKTNNSFNETQNNKNV